ncbi:MAG: NADH-quinone oxidoreductase subunit C [Deltaproteobacteria bacterium]|nr:NADH-quinone oxidoreductase subunit C [Deltaproteobacteria bacterium]
MDATLREALAARFPAVDLDQDVLLVPAADHYPLAALLKEQGYTLYVTVAASHHPGPEGDAFEVATVLRRPVRGAPSVAWRVVLGADPHLQSLYPLFPGADLQEREQLDLVGVRFDGHPNPVRLMLSEDWVGHPLRKDYAPNMPHAPWR